MFGTFLKGRTAVVTGSLSGIGLGVARALSAAGSNIVLNGFAPEAEIKALEKELTNQTSSAKFIFADLTKPSDTKNLIEQSIAHFGKVDILVNNAGMQHISTVEDFPEDIWEKVISLNLSSAFYGTKYALPQMKKNGWGRIINVASVHGLVASVNKSAYVAAKHGIVGFTKAAALENARNGVTVNAICPGFVLTPLIQKQIDIIKEKRGISEQDAAKTLIEEKQPSASFSVPADIGALATFLCTDNARQITGASYTVDGGWTAQ